MDYSQSFIDNLFKERERSVAEQYRVVSAQLAALQSQADQTLQYRYLTHSSTSGV